MMSSDTLASYGGLARFTNIVRLHPVGKNTLIGCTGDLSDFDKVKEHLRDLIIDDLCEDDGSFRFHCSRVEQTKSIKLDSVAHAFASVVTRISGWSLLDASRRPNHSP